MNQITFHIGFHKTATSWMQQVYFSQHTELELINNFTEPWNDPFISYLINPELPFSKKKCASLFSRVTKDNKQKNLVISAERLSGHPISGGCDNIQIAERIKDCFPEARIIIIKREPRSAIESVYKQVVSEGYVGTLYQFVTTNTWKTKGPSINYFKSDILIKTYINLFGSQKVLVLEYEDFLKDKQAFIKNIDLFLQVLNKNSISKNSKIINKSLQNKRIRALRILNYFRSTDIYPNPFIKFHSEFIFKLSRIFSPLFSNKRFLDNKLWNKVYPKIKSTDK
ncbi:MAG: hypothetical protein DRI74_01575 [Bacteroidetes bacterium]|nr:MAG: hypothetical protein DRI74_01575 [Bacteroidota bacterium]